MILYNLPRHTLPNMNLSFVLKVLRRLGIDLLYRVCKVIYVLLKKLLSNISVFLGNSRALVLMVCETWSRVFSLLLCGEIVCRGSKNIPKKRIYSLIKRSKVFISATYDP